jgi:hypothetical protein
MSVYTNLGAGLWSWDPFVRLERHHEDVIGRCTKLFWLALYTTPEAKMVVPGMFVGSVTTMAEASGMPVDSVRVYLDRLLEDDLVEYDIERRVLRMTQLPDCGESPSNGRAIRGWWRRFDTVPRCTVRDAHVTVLRWILDEWSRRNGKPISNDHAQAWSETFGRISVPPVRRRATRPVQTSLFSASGSLDPKFNMLDTNKCSTSVGLDPDTDPDTDQDQDLRSEGGMGGGRLVLMPMPAFDADDLAETLSTATGGRFPKALTRSARQALGAAISAAGASARGEGVLALLGEYIARHASQKVTPEIVTAPGWLEITIEQAQVWRAEAQAKIAAFAAARADAGI